MGRLVAPAGEVVLAGGAVLVEELSAAILPVGNLGTGVLAAGTLGADFHLGRNRRGRISP